MNEKKKSWISKQKPIINQQIQLLRNLCRRIIVIYSFLSRLTNVIFPTSLFYIGIYINHDVVAVFHCWKYALIPFTVSTAIFPRWNVTKVERIERIFFDPSRKCLTEDFSIPLFFPRYSFLFFFHASNSIGLGRWDQLCLRVICRNNLLEIFSDRISK